MPTVTLFFRSDTWTVNGLTAYRLDITNTNITTHLDKKSNGCPQMGIKVWRRTEGGTEYLMSGSVVVARVAPTAMVVERDGTWNCPETPCNATDSIVVRVYICTTGGGTSYLWCTFTTAQLGANKINATTWTVHYWCRRLIDEGGDYWTEFWFGSNQYNSRIENFGYTVTAIVHKLSYRLVNIATQPKGIIKMLKEVGSSMETANLRRPHMPYVTETPVQTASGKKASKARRRLKALYILEIKRAGESVYRFKRQRDLIVWRGQSVLANLLSQGAVGTATASWKVVASENSNAPDMGDDSGNPEANEFNPLIGSAVSATYEFEPTVKPSGAYQTIATLYVRGSIPVTSSKTLRKIGIIDTVAVPNRHIIVEDAVVPVNVINGDTIEITYLIQLG